MKNSIVIGPHFFQQEKRNYSNWRTALIREVVQNSSDSQGCTRIDFTVIKQNDSTVIKIEDNGAGMTKDVLINTFLVMGETTKKDFNSTGGFGKARALICWAQNKYKIQSHDYICTGSGAEYEIKKSSLDFNGCIFEIETDDSDWIEIIKSVLKNCTVWPAIYINGERFNEKLRQSKLIRQLSFADVYVNKSAAPGIHIRSNGCWMFSKYSDIKVQVCVELHKQTARDSLTANRDGLQFKQDNELQQFLNELSANCKSALRDKTRHFTKFVNKNTCFKSKVRPEFKQVSAGGLIKNTDPAPVENIVIKQVLNPGGTSRESVIGFNANPIDEEFLPVYISDPILSSMIILNESNDPKKVQLIKNFYMPEKWDNRNATRYQLIRIWFAICNIVMDELSNYTKNEFAFAVGYNFSDDLDNERTHALHLKSEGVHYLMFNPIDETNKLKYSVNCVDDYFDLIVLACHEATHCIFTAHNEDFSSFFTLFLQKVLNKRKEIVAAAKEAKD